MADNIIKLAKLADDNNYVFKEENGRLVYGPPKDYQAIDEVLPKQSEVFSMFFQTMFIKNF